MNAQNTQDKIMKRNDVGDLQDLLIKRGWTEDAIRIITGSPLVKFQSSLVSSDRISAILDDTF